MSVRNLLSKLLGAANRPARNRVRARIRSTPRSLRLESLEGRAVLSTFAGCEALDAAPADVPNPPALVAPPSTTAMRDATVTVTLQPTNDAPLAAQAPQSTTAMRDATVTVTLQPTNDAPLAAQARPNTTAFDDTTLTVTLRSTNDAPLDVQTPANTNSMRNATVTITLQSTNDVPR